MNKTTYTRQTYVIRDNHGNYLREGSDDPANPVFIDYVNFAQHWTSNVQAQAYAGRINERYTANGITDVWGAPKKVLVHKMTVTTIVEPMSAPDPRQTKMNL